MIDQSNVDRTSSEVSRGARTTRVDSLTAVVVEEVVNVLEVVILKYKRQCGQGSSAQAIGVSTRYLLLRTRLSAILLFPFTHCLLHVIT